MIRKLLLIELDRANFIKNQSEVFVLEFDVFSKLKENLHIFGVLENVPSDAKKTLPKLEVFPFQVFQLCWRMTIHKSPKPEGFRTTSKTWPCTFQMWLPKTFIEFWAKFKTISFYLLTGMGSCPSPVPLISMIGTGTGTQSCGTVGTGTKISGTVPLLKYRGTTNPGISGKESRSVPG